MRPVLGSLFGAFALSIVVAGTALGAHCANESKPVGAGHHATLTINGITGAETFSGLNAAGRITGGFIQIWIDVDGNGAGDVLACEAFLISNHANRPAPGQDEGGFGVLPPIIRGMDPGGADAGLTTC